jgi:hypothetical protein
MVATTIPTPTIPSSHLHKHHLLKQASVTTASIPQPIELGSIVEQGILVAIIDISSRCGTWCQWR